MTVRAGFMKDGITPEDHRLFFSAALVPASAMAVLSGVVGDGGNLVSSGAMTANLGPVRAIIQGTSQTNQGVYPVVVDANEGITIPDGHATLPRIDLVCLQVRDHAYDGLGQQDARVMVQGGSPNASPSAPSAPASSIPLWEVAVPAGVNSSNGGISWGGALTDRRTKVGWFNVNTTAFSTYTPTWSVHSGAAPSYGNAVVRGRYRRDGRQITVNISITMGSTTTYGGGQWRFSLPVPMADAAHRTAFLMQAFDASGVTIRGGFAYINQDAPAGQEIFYIYNDGGSIMTASAPFTWASGDELVLTGTYEAAS